MLYDLELMLRIYLLQNHYGLADIKIMNEVLDNCVFSCFCEIESPNQVSDGNKIRRFKKILVEIVLQKKLFHQIIENLSEKA